MREVAVPNTEFLIECTPGYYNNEGRPVRSHIGEVYGRGYVAFNAVLTEWRDRGDLEGLALGS
jgi:cyclohexanone monooxygenase